MERTIKVWGHEDLIVNNGLYCGKLLVIQPGHQCSLHYHKLKTETFLVLGGTVGLEREWATVDDENAIQSLLLLDSESEPITIEPGVAHRFWSNDPTLPAVMLEISTQHFDNDSYRLEESK